MGIKLLTLKYKILRDDFLLACSNELQVTSKLVDGGCKVTGEVHDEETPCLKND